MHYRKRAVVPAFQILVLGIIFFMATIPAQAQLRFIRGDLDGNLLLDISDLQLLVGGPPYECEDAADVDDDGLAGTLADVNYLTNRIFTAGPPHRPLSRIVTLIRLPMA